MSIIRKALLSLALVAGTTGIAQAADLYRGGSIKDSGYMPAIAYGPSWYVRGDGSWARYDTPDMWENGQWKLTKTHIDSNWALGGGIGHYFSRNIRGDVTYEWRESTEYRGTISDKGNDLPGVRLFNVQSNVMLANLYYDFEFNSRVTPYIGIGLGAVRHNVKKGVVDAFCGCDGTIDGATNWDVAGALMAGLSIKVLGGGQGHHGHGHGHMHGSKDAPMAVASPRALYLDVGYRFLHLGETETGAVRGHNATGGAHVAKDPTVEAVRAHEFRVGLRYDIR